MKKIFTLALLAVASMAANAQYICLEKGTVLSYEGKSSSTEETLTSTTTFTDVTTGADGVITISMEDVSSVPGNPLGSVKETSQAFYNPADSTTTIVVAGAEDSKASIINMLVEGAAQAGQTPTAEQLEEINKEIKVTGQLDFTISPNIPAGTKLKNKSLKLRMGPQTIAFNLWDVKVEGKESVTVPAGTFECLKVSYVQKINAGGSVQKLNSTSWFAEGIGLVRSTTSEKKMDMESTTELVKIEAPKAE